MFLFKTKDPSKFREVDIPGYRLVGGGYYEEYFVLRVSEAWQIWGTGNGVASERELLERVQAYRHGRRYDFDPDPQIGCIALRNIFFADRGAEPAQPPHWSTNNVTIEGYDLTGPSKKVDSDYLLQVSDVLRDHARYDREWDRDLDELYAIERKKFGEYVARHRLGQAAFRIAVDQAYEFHCAVTSSGTYPSLEAAHIVDYSDEGGTHAVTNALLLRRDVHTLYDRGYLGITPDLRLKVSPELRVNGWNGVEFYEKEAGGFKIRVPEDPRLQPDRDALAWHHETKFRVA